MPEAATHTEWIDSTYYQALNDELYEERVRFLNLLLDKMQVEKESKILEVGCGTGKTSLYLSEKGFDVTGIDFSFKAIIKAKELEKDNLQYFQQDIRLPFWINYFDYAFNISNSFGYFKTVREHDNALRVIAQSLKIDGFLVLDYLNVQFEEDKIDESEDKNIGDFQYHFKKWDDDENFFQSIEVKEGETLRGLFQEKLSKFSLGDFTDMFAFQGLQIQEVFGDYNLGSYDLKKSPRLIMIAQKIKKVK